jgi:hypothetical protein
MIKSATLVLATALVLSACATRLATTYGPAQGPQSMGFSDYRIEPGRYRVTFRGGPGAPPNQVADYALLRAADLTLADGFDWFRIADRSFQQPGREDGPRFSLGVGGSSFGGRTGVGVSLGRSFDLGGGPALAQTLEIVMGKGVPPKDADVYDAREIRKSIGPRT